MACYHPMVYIPLLDASIPEERLLMERIARDHKGTKTSRYAKGTLVPKELALGAGINLRQSKAALVPCGRCIGCRLDYSRQWAQRCMYEAGQHENNYFLTLTYDDDHLPRSDKGIATLIQDEVSKFMKRLRSSFKRKFGIEGIRFFACGEYGDGNGDEVDPTKVFRPHYHIILFNCPIPDLQERHPFMVDGKLKWIKQYSCGDAAQKEQLYFSPTIYDCWKVDKKDKMARGSAEIGQVTFESCAYVARYVVKKLYGEGAKEYNETGCIPPFVRMSRDPGIGFDWYMTNFKRIVDFDNVNFKRGEDVITTKPGKYFDKLYKKRDEDKYYCTKKKRREDYYDSIDCLTFEAKDVVENNHRKEDVKIHSIKQLKRSL